MELPFLGNAIVPEAKPTKYLLSPVHEDGAGKAQFFRSFGFVAEDWAKLAEALMDHVRGNGIVKEEITPFGTRYVAEGPIAAADHEYVQFGSLIEAATFRVL